MYVRRIISYTQITLSVVTPVTTPHAEKPPCSRTQLRVAD